MKLETSTSIFLIVALIVTFLDIPLTLMGVAKLGIGYEGNPRVAYWLINDPNIWIFIKGLTAVFATGILVLFFYLPEKSKKFSLIAYLTAMFMVSITFIISNIAWVRLLLK